MNIHAISESIKELLAEQNHDVTTITIRSMMDRIIALNNIVEQFVNVTNQNEEQSTELGISNTEVLQLHQFSEYIAILDDTDFNTNLNECKLVNKELLIHVLSVTQQLKHCSLEISVRQEEDIRRQGQILKEQIEMLKILANER
jgi:hypothetical protein